MGISGDRRMSRNFESMIASLADTLAAGHERTGLPFLAAIDGPSGAGKSTFAQALARRTAAALIAGDDFYAGGTEVHALGPEELAELCIDRAGLRRVLQELKSGKQARYAPFDWERFDGGLAEREIVVEPVPIVIVEGVYVRHPDLADLVDYSVLVRVPRKERERRLHKREGGLSDWERQWQRAEDWYFANLARPKSFDMIIDND